MSILDRVRQDFKTPTQGTSKTSKSPSAGSAGSSHTRSDPSAGSAGSIGRHAGGDLPIEPAKPAEGEAQALTKLTEPPFGSFAGAPPPPKTFAGLDVADLEEWRAPLVLGRLAACGNCARYTPRTDPNGTGSCSLHGDGLLPFLPFACREFQAAKSPAAPSLLPGAPR